MVNVTGGVFGKKFFFLRGKFFFRGENFFRVVKIFFHAVKIFFRAMKIFFSSGKNFFYLAHTREIFFRSSVDVVRNPSSRRTKFADI